MRKVYKLKQKNIFAIILAFFAGAGVCFLHLSRKVYNAAKEVSTEIVNDVIDDIYPCKLAVIYKYNQDEESTITDFSKYEEKGIIGLIFNSTEEKDCEEHTLYYKQAVVYRIGDTWLWKVL